MNISHWLATILKCGRNPVGMWEGMVVDRRVRGSFMQLQLLSNVFRSILIVWQVETINTFTASIFLVFHQFSKVDREFNSMNLQRRNVSSERILILVSNTTDLFNVAVSKDFPQTILCHQIFHQKSWENAIFLSMVLTSSNPFPSVPKLYTAIAIVPSIAWQS
jgi:hypothetical protein